MGEVAVPAGEAVIHIHPTAFIAPGAVVLGDVTLGARASVWYGAVLRGDMDAIVIGEATNVQDGTIVHVDEGAPVRIGARVGVGHRATPRPYCSRTPSRSACSATRELLLPGSTRRRRSPPRSPQRSPPARPDISRSRAYREVLR